MSLSTFVISIVSQAQCASAPLALSVDCKNLSGPLIVSAFDPTQPSQLWLPMSVNEQVFQFSGISVYDNVVAFINVLTGLALYSQGRDGSAALQVPVAQLGALSLWDCAGSGYMAIRLAIDENQNLRINGAHPFTSGMPVTTDGWAGGTPNEVWTCIQTSSPFPSAFDHIPYSLLPSSIEAGAGLCLSSNGTCGDTSPLTVQTPDVKSTSQQFYIPVTFDANTGSPNGVALLNVATGNAAQASGDGDGSVVNQVSYPPLSGRSIWTLATQGFTNQSAIRPLADIGQNINIPGDGPYTPGQEVCTWDWGGGAANEIWAPMLVTSHAKKLRHSSKPNAHANKDKQA